MIQSLIQGMPAWLAGIVEASIYATVVAVLVLGVLMVAGRRIPARWRFALWFLVLVRLVPLPMPESRVSLFNLFGSRGERAAVASSEPVVMPPINTAPLALAATPVTKNAEPEPGIAGGVVDVQAAAGFSTPDRVIAAASTSTPAREFPWAKLLVTVYASGALLFALRQFLATRALMRMIRRGRAAEDPRLLSSLDAARRTLSIRKKLPLMLLEGLSSPALVGYFRPRLLLSAEVAETLSAEDLRHIFLHECAHLKRRDVLLNYVIALLTIVHWFNPLLHLLLPRIRADRELATDELALAHAEPALYGQTLLNLFQSNDGVGRGVACRAPASVAISETRSFFARRIHMIARFQKKPAWLGIPAAIALASAAACTLTGPVSEGQAAPEQRSVIVRSAGDAPATQPETRPAPSGGNPDKGQAGARVAAELATDAANKATRDKLEVKLADVNVDDQPLEKVLTFLQESSRTNFHVNWGALESSGIAKNNGVTLHLADVPYRRALVSVLESASGNVRLGYTVEDGVVIISTMDDLRNAPHIVNRVYNIRDFIASAGDVGAQTQALVDLIKANVEPDTWRDVNGNIGSIRDFNGLLSITTSSDIQYQVAQLLRTMSLENAGASSRGPAGSTDAAIQAKLEAAYAENKAMRAALAAGQSRFPEASSTDVAGDAQVQALQMQLNTLEQDRAAMIVRSTPSKQELIALDARIKTVREQLDQAHVKSEALANEQKDKQAKRDAEANAHVETQIYDVHALGGIPDGALGANAEQRTAVEALAATLRRITGIEKISSFEGQIIVEATPEMQAKVNAILEKLQLSRRPQK
jgi:beta-lactamase regulating signal transducer with metallopeptidase domain